MTLSNPLRRTASLAAITAVAATAALGATASAATIGAPEVLKPGQSLPIDIPGYREPADNRSSPTTAWSAWTSPSSAASAPRPS